MHEDPQVPNFGEPGRGPVLEEGMVLAIEPMVTAGRHAVRMGDDHWAIFSQDGSLAAHFEFTVAVTPRARGSSPRGTPTARPTAAPRPRRHAAPGRWPLLSFSVAPKPGASCCLTPAKAAAPAPRSAVPQPQREQVESPTLGQADVREVQDHPPSPDGPGDLSEPPPQAAAGLVHGAYRRHQPAAQQARRGRAHLHLRGRALDVEQDPRRGRHLAGHLRPRSHRRRGRQAP